MELILLDDVEWWYLVRYIDEKLQYVLSLMHNQSDTIRNNLDFQKAYIALNDCLCKLEVLAELEEEI